MELVIRTGAQARNMVCRELAWLGLGLGQQSRGFGERGHWGRRNSPCSGLKNRYVALK